MSVETTVQEITYQMRLESLRETKMLHTREKQEVVGSMDHDDWALILPPPERRKVVKTISTSGMPITDVLLEGYEPVPNHPSGGFFGPKACGENFGALMRAHPPYVDPMASLLGGYNVNFSSYRKVRWNPDFDYSHLQPYIDKYKLISGIGASQHFCQDLEIGFKLGWSGLLDKIRFYRAQHGPEKADFYDGLEAIVTGMQAWIKTNVDEARRLAEKEENPQLRENLLKLADMNERLITEPPQTFHEACQWMAWYQMAARMYNGSGSLGRLDVLLQPYYERDVAAGILTDEEAIFHIANLLLLDTAYIQLGGPLPDGRDATSKVSYLVLEAAHRLRIPANIGVTVGPSTDPGLLRRGVEIMFQDRTGIPKFLGTDNIIEGFARNGYDLSMARQRAYSGCHWFAIPGREYTLNDCVKINLGAVFEVAWEEMMQDVSTASVEKLWNLFQHHLKEAIKWLARCLDFHMEHMHQVFPELVLDLLCYGPIERGEDASHGGVDYYNLCVDGAALATVTDSFAALEQRIEKEKVMTWEEIKKYIETNWAGPDGERARLMMRNIPRFGSGGSRADEWAVKITEVFTRFVKESPTPNGFNMIPGYFSWANTIPMGKVLKATPNGRRAGEPISHGANPDPGFRKDGAPSAMAVAIASVQPGWGNSAPMQIELDPGITRDEEGIENIANLIKTHMDLGGTQINMNVMDADKVLEAHKDPSKYPDLVVRVTGFSAYFASLSPEFRQLVVDRIIREREASS
ncbi:MAG: formate acetyltransferase [Chloroflexi bacterium]|nr:formate acetyltransferase [Chloroflexota bacterium]